MPRETDVFKAIRTSAATRALFNALHALVSRRKTSQCVSHPHPPQNTLFHSFSPPRPPPPSESEFIHFPPSLPPRQFSMSPFPSHPPPPAPELQYPRRSTGSQALSFPQDPLGTQAAKKKRIMQRCYGVKSLVCLSFGWGTADRHFPVLPAFLPPSLPLHSRSHHPPPLFVSPPSSLPPSLPLPLSLSLSLPPVLVSQLFQLAPPSPLAKRRRAPGSKKFFGAVLCVLPPAILIHSIPYTRSSCFLLFGPLVASLNRFHPHTPPSLYLDFLPPPVSYLIHFCPTPPRARCGHAMYPPALIMVKPTHSTVPP